MADHKRKGGRPKLSPEAVRSSTLHVRVTSAEEATVLTGADRAGIPLPDFLRRLLLERRIEVAPPREAFAYAADVTRLAADLRRLERLATAGRIVGVDVTAIEQLHARLHQVGLAALNLEREEDACLPSSSRAEEPAALSATSSGRRTTPGGFATKSKS